MRKCFVCLVLILSLCCGCGGKSKEYYYDLGYRALTAGDYTNAILHYSQAIELDSTYGAAYFNRGMAYWKLGDKATAVADLQKASTLGEENAEQALKLLLR